VEEGSVATEKSAIREEKKRMVVTALKRKLENVGSFRFDADGEGVRLTVSFFVDPDGGEIPTMEEAERLAEMAVASREVFEARNFTGCRVVGASLHYECSLTVKEGAVVKKKEENRGRLDVFVGVSGIDHLGGAPCRR
jgi:hypothetical protein